jgi:hypothetical protein
VEVKLFRVRWVQLTCSENSLLLTKLRNWQRAFIAMETTQSVESALSYSRKNYGTIILRLSRNYLLQRPSARTQGMHLKPIGCRDDLPTLQHSTKSCIKGF